MVRGGLFHGAMDGRSEGANERGNMQREEIAAWLREAAEHSERMGYKHLKEYFLKRTAQVDAMRCETCNNRSYSHCSKFNQHILGLEEGCFHHEQEV